jgi:hypothetical protein
MTSPDLADCLGFLTGVADTLTALKVVCMTPSVTVEQLKDIVMNFLSAHPESRHFSGAVQAAAALKQAFPCKEQAH